MRPADGTESPADVGFAAGPDLAPGRCHVRSCERRGAVTVRKQAKSMSACEWVWSPGRLAQREADADADVQRS